MVVVFFRPDRNTDRGGLHCDMCDDTVGGGHCIVLQQVGQDPHARTISTKIPRRGAPSELSNGRVG